MFIATAILVKINEYPTMVLRSNIAISHIVWLYYLPGNQGLYDTGQIMWDFLSRFTTEVTEEEPLN